MSDSATAVVDASAPTLASPATAPTRPGARSFLSQGLRGAAVPPAPSLNASVPAPTPEQRQLEAAPPVITSAETSPLPIPAAVPPAEASQSVAPAAAETSPPASAAAAPPAEPAQPVAPAAVVEAIAPLPGVAEAEQLAAASAAARTEAPVHRPPLPEEFAHDAQALADRAPMLRRTLARLWNDPQFTEVERVRRMQDKVIEARNTPIPESPETKMAQLAREGKMDDLARAAIANDDLRQRQQQSFALASSIIANTHDLDPEDPDYLAAADEASLKALIMRSSPIVREAREQERAQLQTAHEQQIAAINLANEQRIVALNGQWQAKLEAAVTAAKAQSDAGRPAPPRMVSDVLPPNSPNLIPPNRSDQVRLTRSLLASGYHQTGRMREGLPAQQ